MTSSISVVNPSISSSNNTNANASSTSTSSSGISQGGDERQMAKQAFELAEETVRSLCVEYAQTLVSVERRSVTLEVSLQRLLEEITLVSSDTLRHVQNYLPSAGSSSSSTVVAILPTEEKDVSEAVDITHHQISPPPSSSSSSSCNPFQKISQRHQQRRRTLLQHSTLMELLELPNVMDACIRSELYEEALQISSFANTLERRHDLRSSTSTPYSSSASSSSPSPSIRVIASVVDEIRLREGELRHYLLQQCTKEITMPQCLELVTALRRLNNLELERQSSSAAATSTTTAHKDLETTHSSMELKLQVDFLEARDLWLQKHHMSYPTTVTTASTTTNEQLLDWIEHYRTKCFEIATQFTTIFGTTTTTSSTTTTETNTSTNTKPYSLLSLWFSRVLQSFLLQLQKQLDTITSTTTTTTTTTTSGGTTVMSTLRDVLDATTFFATSMGRIGGDFTPLLPQIFEARVVRIVTRMWTEATDAFDQTLRICRDVGIASPLITTTTITTTTTTTTASSSTNIDHPNYDAIQEGGVLPSEFGMTTINAPRSLLQYPPLARFVNTYMSSLNDLRRCLLPGTFPLLLSNLTDKIIPSMKFILEANERKLLTPGMLRGDTLQLRQLASQYKVQLADVVEPFLLDALRMALGYDYNTAKKDSTTSTSNTTSTTNNRNDGTTNTSTIVTDIDPNTENQQEEGDADDEKATSDEHSMGHEVQSNEVLYNVADTMEHETDTSNGLTE